MYDCYLVILYRKHYVFYRIRFNCTNRIQHVLQLFFVTLNLFRVSFMQMKLTCMWRIFRFIFKFVLPCLFLKCICLFCLTCKKMDNENAYEGAETEERKKNKEIIFNSKIEFGKWSFIFFFPLEKLKFGPFSFFPNLFTNIQFWSKVTPLLDVLNRHSMSPPQNFGIFLENVNYEINIVTYSFFLYWCT